MSYSTDFDKISITTKKKFTKYLLHGRYKFKTQQK
jgi:hypothetical protein